MKRLNAISHWIFCGIIAAALIVLIIVFLSHGLTLRDTVPFALVGLVLMWYAVKDNEWRSV